MKSNNHLKPYSLVRIEGNGSVEFYLRSANGEEIHDDPLFDVLRGPQSVRVYHISKEIPDGVSPLQLLPTGLDPYDLKEVNLYWIGGVPYYENGDKERDAVRRNDIIFA